MIKNVSDIVAGRLDLIIISKFLSLQDVGLFAFTYRFLNLAAEFPVRFSAGVYPLFTRLHVLKEDAKTRLLYIRLSSALYLGINMAVLLLLVFYVDLFKFFAKENIDLAASWPIFLLAIPGVVSASLYLPANHFLFAAGWHRYVSISSIFMAVAKLTASIALVKLYGLPGVVLSTILVRCTFHQLVIVRKACQEMAIPLMEYIRDVHVKMILPILTVGLTLWFTKNSGLFSKSLFLNIIFCSSLAFSLGVVVWFLLTASGFEIEYLKRYLAKIRGILAKNSALETSN